jgi:2-dehydro-3-deoxyphosphogluconate aldolase/(4S)-4-hydroxy-2-oxoglutarate aldolase
MNLLAELRSRRLVAIIRGTDADAAVRSASALAAAGIALIEVSLTTPDAFSVISRARVESGDGVHVGAGTVITADDANRAADAGAAFAVTPAITPGLTVLAERGIPVLCGALSPTEVVTAMRQGAAAVKLFPASLGGVPYLKALRDPFPGVPFVPVGGVDADAARGYLAAGAAAVGVGSPLVGDAASGGSLEGLQARARRFLAVANGPAADDREPGPESGR